MKEQGRTNKCTQEELDKIAARVTNGNCFNISEREKRMVETIMVILDYFVLLNCVIDNAGRMWRFRPYLQVSESIVHFFSNNV